MENFAQKLGWPFEGSSVPARSSVADTTEDVVARVVKKELARFGGTGGTGGLAEASVRSITAEVVAEKLRGFTPASSRVKEARVVSSGSVSLAAGENSAAFRVVGPVSYDAGITWVGSIKPESSFRGAVSLLRVEGGGVLGVAAAIAGATSPVTPAPVTPTPAPVTPTAETAAYSFVWAHSGFYISPTTKSMFYKKEADGWVDAWQFPRREDTWEPVESTHATYREQGRNINVQAKAPALLREGEGYRFRSEAPMSGDDYVSVSGTGGTSTVNIQDGSYVYAKNNNYAGVFGTPGTQYADGSWNKVPVRAGDTLEFVNEEDGYLTGRVVRADGAREQIFSFKNAPKADSEFRFHGWNFKKAKVEIIRGGK
nr:MAG TPA: hypothetical protein [Caudoviricetes sp.]